MIGRFFSVSSVLALAFISSAHATPFAGIAEGSDDYLTIASVTVEPTGRGRLSHREATALGLMVDSSPLGNGTGIVGGLIGSIIDGLTDPGKWIAFGQRAWDIVQAGRPVANVTSMRVSVMPVAEADWAQMSNWQGPATQGYSLVAKNLFGMTVVQLDYRVIYNFGGQLNGKGAYLANTTVLPTKVDVLWGFTVDANVEAQRVVNVGSTESPVPGLEMTVHYTLSSALKRSEGRESFFVKGTGETTRLTR